MKDIFWNNWVIRTAIKWEDIVCIVHKTGIDVIDNDYQFFIEQTLEMNSLINLINTDNFDMKLIERQKKLFDELYSYTKEQFSKEEKLIKEYSLPDYERQKEGHNKILRMLKGTIKSFDEGKLKVLHNFKIYFLG